MTPSRVYEAVGLDLGTSNTLACIYRNDRLELVPFGAGLFNLPSVVGFTDNGIVIGDSAVHMKKNEGLKVAYSAKRLLGHKYNDSAIQNSLNLWPNYIKANKVGNPVFAIQQSDGIKEYSPIDIGRFVLEKAANEASKFIGFPLKKAVLTIPANFNHHQRIETLEIAKSVGLDVMYLLNEPSAAAIAYAHQTMNESEPIDKSNQNGIFLMYDLGGGTFDVTVLEVIDGKTYRVLSSDGDQQLGGDDFDQIVMDETIKFMRKNGWNGNLESARSQRYLAELRLACKEGKECLLQQASTRIDTSKFLEDGEDYLLMQASLRVLIQHRIHGSFDIVERVLNSLNLKPLDVDRFIFVGGSARLRCIREIFAERFGPEAERRAFFNINCDSAVVKGAMLMAKSMIDQEEFKVEDCIGYQLSLEISKGLSFPLVPKLTRLPFGASWTGILSSSPSSNNSIRFKLLQGDSDVASKNALISEVLVPLLAHNQVQHPTNGSCQLSMIITQHSQLFIHIFSNSTRSVHSMHVPLGGEKCTESCILYSDVLKTCLEMLSYVKMTKSRGPTMETLRTALIRQLNAYLVHCHELSLNDIQQLKSVLMRHYSCIEKNSL